MIKCQTVDVCVELPASDAKISMFINCSGWQHILGRKVTAVTSLPFQPACQFTVSTTDQMLDVAACGMMKGKEHTIHILGFCEAYLDLGTSTFWFRLIVIIQWTDLHILGSIQHILTMVSPLHVSAVFLQDVQKHSAHTLVFRSLKRTHEYFLSDQTKPPARDETAWVHV